MVLSSLLLTGAEGAMGQVLRPALRSLAAHVRLMARDGIADPAPNEEVVLADLRDFDAVSRAVTGVDTVVHLAGIADEAGFDEILDNNIVGTYHVFEAARRHSVRRIVYASSNHVVGFYPRSLVVGTDEPPRPDSYYGVSKVFGEALGRLYHDKWDMEVVCLRIGCFRERPRGRRQLSAWLSHRDAVQLFERSVTVPDVGFLVAYGVSANDSVWWSNEPGAALLGFEPVDNASHHDPIAAGDGEHDISEHGIAADYQGGAFVQQDYVGGLY